MVRSVNNKTNGNDISFGFMSTEVLFSFFSSQHFVFPGWLMRKLSRSFLSMQASTNSSFLFVLFCIPLLTIVLSYNQVFSFSPFLGGHIFSSLLYDSLVVHSFVYVNKWFSWARNELTSFCFIDSFASIQSSLNMKTDKPVLVGEEKWTVCKSIKAWMSENRKDNTFDVPEKRNTHIYI